MSIMENSIEDKILPQFRFLESTTEINFLLEERLPKSANVFNMSRIYDNYKKPEEMAFYVMSVGKEEIQEENTWVLASYRREDYGMRYAISAPKNATTTPAIKEAFAKCPYINWNERYMFPCVDFNISSMIYEISAQVFGNSITCMPCKIFVMSNEKASKLNVPLPDEGLVLQPLDLVKGTKFICETWKYSLPEKTALAVEKLLRNIKSVGLYSDGNVICGMCTNDCGLMGMLHTKPEHRGKGYATLVAKQLLKTLALEIKAVPCSAVEIRNHQSIAFHEKLGMTCELYADFIKHTPTTWD